MLMEIFQHLTPVSANSGESLSFCKSMGSFPSLLCLQIAGLLNKAKVVSSQAKLNLSQNSVASFLIMSN